MNNIFKTIVAASLVVCFSIANASNNIVTSLEDVQPYVKYVCDDAVKVARNVMEIRQSGSIRTIALDTYDETLDRGYFNELVDNAYDIPLEHVEEHRDRVIKIFEKRQEQLCTTRIEAWVEYMLDQDMKFTFNSNTFEINFINGESK